MIRSKTYQGSAGLNYIEASELVFTTVHKVSREGTQYDLFNEGGSSNRTYQYRQSEGRIYFPIAFNEGEKVFVIYNGSSFDEGVTCTPASLVYTNLPNGRVGLSYSAYIFFSGTLPFNLSSVSITNSWATVSLFGSGVRITGTPDTTGTHTLSFDLENCGTSLPFTETFEVGPEGANMEVINLSSTGASISNVSGLRYTIKSGSFPVNYNQTLTASHGNYLGAVSVNVVNVSFPCTLTIYVDGGAMETINVTSSGIKTFSSFFIFTVNQINIVLS